jgi:hypothetical protein
MSAAGIMGFDKQFGQHASVCSFNALTVNGTTSGYLLTVPVGFGKIRIERIEWVASAVLNDADGTILAVVTARDVSEAADDVLVASVTLEGGTAHVPAAFTLATETSEKELTLEEGDSLRVVVTNNTATIDTNGAVAFTVYYHSIPRETAGDDIKHATFYTQA